VVTGDPSDAADQPDPTDRTDRTDRADSPARTRRRSRTQPAGSCADDSAQQDAIARTAVQRFVGTEPAGTVAVVERLGRPGARIVVVAADGRFGDAVVSSVAAAERICDELGVPRQEWDRELSARISPSPADRRRMAGTGR
jgi:hypothetical protein